MLETTQIKDYVVYPSNATFGQKVLGRLVLKSLHKLDHTCESQQHPLAPLLTGSYGGINMSSTSVGALDAAAIGKGQCNFDEPTGKIYFSCMISQKKFYDWCTFLASKDYSSSTWRSLSHVDHDIIIILEYSPSGESDIRISNDDIYYIANSRLCDIIIGKAAPCCAVADKFKERVKDFISKKFAGVKHEN